MKTHPLYVKPILLFSEQRRVEFTSWRVWGAITSRLEAQEESERIKKELNYLESAAHFPLKILELDLASSLEDVLSIEKELSRADVVLLYAAGGGVNEINEIAKRKKTLIFVRWKSGPYYLWHEIADARLVRMNTSDKPINPWISLEDIVVDDYNELLSKLRALYALKNVRGRRILCIGGAWGWEIGSVVTVNATRTWGLDIITVPYSELEAEIKSVEEREKDAVERLVKNYISQSGVEVKVPLENVRKSFVLYIALKNLAQKYEADSVTSPGCMTNIIQIAKTPPCLPYSLLNDEDMLGICEGDFVAIPAFILLRLISGKPVFFANPTLPQHGEVLVAHCTAPRRMDGTSLLPAELYTHFESNEGTAIRVLMKRGEVVTVVNPSFDGKSWVVFKGEIVDAPFYPACRTQAVIKIHGDWTKLRYSMRGFHWLIVYGDYVDPIVYALKKMGVEPVMIS